MQNDTLTTDVWYTQSKDEKQMYVLVLHWPENSILYLGSLKVSVNTSIFLLGSDQPIKVSTFNHVI